MNPQTQPTTLLQDEDWEALDNDPVENLKAIEAFAAQVEDPPDRLNPKTGARAARE